MKATARTWTVLITGAVVVASAAAAVGGYVSSHGATPLPTRWEARFKCTYLEQCQGTYGSTIKWTQVGSHVSGTYGSFGMTGTIANGSITIRFGELGYFRTEVGTITPQRLDLNGTIWRPVPG